MQTFAVSRVASFLSKELHAKVEIEKVNIEFLKTIVLKGIFIEDQQHDTLLYAKKLKAEIGLHDLFSNNKKLKLTTIELTDAIIELKRYKEISGLNFDFIADYFSSPTTSSDSSQFDFSINKIQLINTKFSYRDLRWNDYTPAIDFEDIHVIDLNAIVTNLRLEDDTVYFDAQTISLKEEKGFVINKFSSDVKIAQGLMQFDDLKIKTPFSDIQTQFALQYDSLVQFEDFINAVRIKSSFDRSKIASNDLKYFATELYGLNQTILFSGKVRGTINSLKGKEVEIQFGKSSSFKGDISVAGLPNVEETFINLKIDNLLTSKSDIETIKNFPFDSSSYIQLPENISRLGNVSFNGMFTGFYNDFVAYGNIKTAIGFLSTDINLKFNPEMQRSSYSGKIVASNFDFGKFWNNSIIGKASFDAKVMGSGFQSDKVAATMDGNIKAITLNNYTYNNIKLDGEVSRKLFSGNFSVDEPNLKLDFDGSVDFRGKLPVFDFTSVIDRAFLTKLNILKRDTSVNFSATLALNMEGLQIDELDGTIQLADVKYNELNKNFNVDNISYSSAKAGTQRLIKLNSDLADVTMQGDFRLVNLPAMIFAILNKYMPPVVFNKTNVAADKQEMTFAASINNVNPVLDIFVPGLSISPGAKINGQVSAKTGLVNITGNIPHIIYNTVKVSELELSSKNKNAELVSSVTVKEIKIGDSLFLRNNSVAATTQKEKASIDLKILNNDSSDSRVEIFTTEEFITANKTILKILPSTIKIEKQNWNIDQGNSIIFDSTGISINQLAFESNRQLLQVNGKVSKNSNDILNIGIGNFNTALLNQLLQVYDVSVGGTANGALKLSSLYAKPIVESDLKINDLRYFDDTLGNATATIHYNELTSKILFDCYVENNGKREITFDGFYQMKPVDDFMDFNIKVTRINAKPLTRYLTSFAKEFNGLVSAELKLAGLAKAPLLTGKAKIQKGSMLIDYTNTRYFFTHDEIVFNEKYIGFDDLELNDRFGNKGILTGKIYHNSFSDFIYNIQLTTNKLYCLNTTATQNELFYGTGFASGKCKIFGTENLVSFDIALKTLAGTQINIPLSSANEVTEKDFITFISHDSSLTVKKESGVNLSGIDLDLKLEVTPAAQIKLILDEKIGDEMTGNGSGNISMKITPAGEFSMFGEYTIEKGDYLFTMQDVINKRFDIDNGGSIRWSGDPYNAEIDITAKYKHLRASTYDLLQDTSNRKRIPVELMLMLTGNLFNPTVNFKIEVPGLDASMQNQLNSRLSTEQELNRQVFSLLVLNRFSTPEELSVENQSNQGSSNTVGANAGELLSNQVTNWLSKLSRDFNVGVNYRPGDQLNAKDEFEVSLSTELFNERVSIDGSFGTNNNNNSGNASNVIGDFNVEFKASKDGRIRLRAFNKTNNNNFINSLNSQYTQGIGVFYREEFNNGKELSARIRERKKKKTETTSMK